AKGYETPELWDPDARALVAGFTDGCPGAKCGHLAPRTWVAGDFGDAANAQRPVTGVTVHEARAYAAWLSKTTGARWRLATEREWEVAAGWDPEKAELRAYPWGAELLDGVGTIETVARPVGERASDVTALGMVDAGTSVREWVVLPEGGAGLK